MNGPIASHPGAMPPDWDDANYLSLNPDVGRAVRAGRIASGYDHYLRWGRAENRSGGWRPAEGRRMTRSCTDPWHYLEIDPDFGLKPCCRIPAIVRRTGDAPVAPLRDDAAFRKLRGDLLSGELGAHCRDCHIRPLVPVERFREVIGGADAQALLARPLRQVRLELTTRCNLRCVYCPVSLPDYRGMDLPQAHFDAVLAVIAEAPTDAEVLINGHGETTFHPDWVSLAARLLEQGRRLSIITNLARLLTDAEAGCLAGFATIQISLDTVDPQLLPQIRRKVRLDTILGNMARIRDAAARRGSAPAFALSVGVYDLSVAGLPRLCEFAVANGIGAVTFWTLVKYDDVPDAVNVYPVESLEAAQIRQAVDCMEQSLQILRAAGIQYHLAGSFMDGWRQRLASP